MKIQRGKVAILLVLMVMVVPGGFMTAFSIRDNAMNACTASPPSDPLKLDDFSASVDLRWSTLSWVCHREYTDEDGEPNGITSTLTFPLIPQGEFTRETPSWLQAKAGFLLLGILEV